MGDAIDEPYVANIAPFPISWASPSLATKFHMCELNETKDAFEFSKPQISHVERKGLGLITVSFRDLLHNFVMAITHQYPSFIYSIIPWTMA